VSIGKKISRSAHIGEAGVAFIHQWVSAMGHVWHERHTDAGIDGFLLRQRFWEQADQILS